MDVYGLMDNDNRFLLTNIKLSNIIQIDNERSLVLESVVYAEKYALLYRC